MSEEGPLPDFLEEALRIIREADKRGIPIRLMGACAIRLHLTPETAEFHEKTLDRQLTDLDFMSYRKFIKEARKLFTDLGYIWDEYLATVYPDRDLFHDPVNKRTVDLFYDRLYMCHTIDFRGRLELDHPTITVSDLLLEKLQIVKMGPKDVKDLIVLFMDHDVGESDEDMINKKYIAKLFANDWGFYYTATTNLKRLRDEFLDAFKVPEDKKEVIVSRINALLEAIEAEPKSLKWKMRAKIGPKKKWYREVEEVMR